MPLLVNDKSRVETDLAFAGVSRCFHSRPRALGVCGLCPNSAHRLTGPQRPAVFERRQQPHRTGPGGAQGLRTHVPNPRDHSPPSPSQLLAQQPIFRSRASQSGCGIWGGGVSKGIAPLHSPQSSLCYGEALKQLRTVFQSYTTQESTLALM